MQAETYAFSLQLEITQLKDELEVSNALNKERDAIAVLQAADKVPCVAWEARNLTNLNPNP